MFNLKCLFYLCLIAVFSSCRLQRANRSVYAAQASNVPYFNEKGDAKLTGYYSGDDKPKNGGYNLQGAYAVTDRLVILAAYTRKHETQEYNYDSLRFSSGFFNGNVQTNIYDSSLINYKRNSFEVGAGYIFPLNSKKTVTYNLYAGASFGNFTMDDKGFDSVNHPYARYYTAKTLKPWLQGAFNFMFPDASVNFSVGGKWSLLRFSQQGTSYTAHELNYLYLDKINNKSFFMWEPYINLQAGVPRCPWAKIELQAAFCNYLGDNYPKVRGYSGSIGLTFSLPGGH